MTETQTSTPAAEEDQWSQSWWTPERIADQQNRFKLMSTDPKYPINTGEVIYREMSPEQWTEYTQKVKEDRGLIKPEKKGLFGRLFKRSDIDGRMNAWHGADVHPEMTSRFLKGGQPLTRFANVKEEPFATAVRMVDPQGYKIVMEEGGPVPAKWNSPAFMSKVKENVYRLGYDKGSPEAAVQAYRNKQAALEEDADKDGDTEMRRIWDRDIGPWEEAPEGEEMAQTPMNRIGAEKLKSETVDKDMGLKNTQTFLAPTPAEVADKVKDSIVIKSATLIDGYLGGLQDRGYITRDQREFLKSEATRKRQQMLADSEKPAKILNDIEDPMLSKMAEGYNNSTDIRDAIHSTVDAAKDTQKRLQGKDNYGVSLQRRRDWLASQGTGFVRPSKKLNAGDLQSEAQNALIEAGHSPSAAFNMVGRTDDSGEPIHVREDADVSNKLSEMWDQLIDESYWGDRGLRNSKEFADLLTALSRLYNKSTERQYRISNAKFFRSDEAQPIGSIEDFNKSEDISPEEYQAMADAAAEEGPDDFEAPGIAHMKDTKKERNSLIQPIVHDKNKARGADNVGYRVGYNGTNGTIYGGNVTPMDVSVDNASYLEALMEKGLITPEQYKEARRAFSDGVTLGRNDYLDDLYERESGRDL